MDSTPSFRIWQSEENVFIQIEYPQSIDDKFIRVVVDNNNIFGLAGSNIYLPLIFEEGSLENGMINWEESIITRNESAPISISRSDKNQILISLRKTKVGKQIENLDKIKPSVFDFPKSGDEGQDEEERLAGLEMLQRGIDAMNKGDLNDEVESKSSISSPLPFPPSLNSSVKSLVHEWREDVSQSNSKERKIACEEAEEDKWDEGIYLYSFVDEQQEIEECLRFDVNATIPESSKPSKIQQQVLTEVQKRDAHLLLLELLLAFAYDRRITLADPSVESGWTIAKLCRSLVGSYLPSSQESDDQVNSILRSSIRRQLCYPLHRNWKLSIQVGRDVVEILQKSEIVTFNSICQIQSIFQQSNEDEAFSIYLESIIEPLLYWFGTLFTSDSLTSLANEVNQSIKEINKEIVGPNWNLEEIEQEAKNALERGETGQFY